MVVAVLVVATAVMFEEHRCGEIRVVAKIGTELQSRVGRPAQTRSSRRGGGRAAFASEQRLGLRLELVEIRQEILGLRGRLRVGRIVRHFVVVLPLLRHQGGANYKWPVREIRDWRWDLIEEIM